MTILLWITFVMALGSCLGIMGRAIKPQMSKPTVDYTTATIDLGLAMWVLWAIARGW